MRLELILGSSIGTGKHSVTGTQEPVVVEADGGFEDQWQIDIYGYATLRPGVELQIPTMALGSRITLVMFSSRLVGGGAAPVAGVAPRCALKA